MTQIFTDLKRMAGFPTRHAGRRIPCNILIMIVIVILIEIEL